MNTASVQLSLLRRPAFALSARGRFARSVRDTYATLLDFVLLLRCQGRVTGVGRRLPYAHARGWSNRECLRLLGVDRRELPKLEKCGLIRFEGADLVLTKYRESTQWREEERCDHLRRIGRVGGVKSGESRRKRSIATLGSWPLPHQEQAHIRASVLNIIKELASSAGSTALDSPSGAGAHRSRFEEKSGGESDGAQPRSGSPDPSKNRPIWAPSDLGKVGGRVGGARAQLVIRGTRARARTGRSVPSPRGSNNADPAVHESAPGPDRKPVAPGGGRAPDFKAFYDFYVGLTGKFHLRAAAQEIWARLAMTAGERRQLLRFAADNARPPEKRPASAAAFLSKVWRPVLETQRRLSDGGPAAAPDLVASVIGRLKNRSEKRLKN